MCSGENAMRCVFCDFTTLRNCSSNGFVPATASRFFAQSHRLVRDETYRLIVLFERPFGPSPCSLRSSVKECFLVPGARPQ